MEWGRQEVFVICWVFLFFFCWGGGRCETNRDSQLDDGTVRKR